jgi:DNA-directed RNA polymerase III subunit RPC11
MLFCPHCGNTLLVESGARGNRFYCLTCPYVHDINQTYRKVVPLQRKKVDDVLGGEEAWKNVDSTEATCPACANDRAYFLSIQIRSADEPSTIFYRCTVPSCSKTWSDR